MHRLAAIALVLVACKDSKPAGTEAASKPAPTQSAAPSAREALLALTPATPVPGKRVTLPATPSRVGDLVVMTKDTLISGLGESEGKSIRWSTTMHVVRAMETLALDGEAITKARVTYRELTTTTKELDGSTTVTPMPRLGRTYLVEWLLGSLSVKREDGAAITEEEEGELRDDLLTDSKPSAADAVLTGRVLESGLVVALPAEAIAAEMADGVTLTTAEARLVDVRGDVAVIETHLVGTIAREDTPMSLESRDLSEISIATGDVLRVSGASALAGTADGIAMTNRVEGTQRYEITRK